MFPQRNRPKENARWRGKVLQISPKGVVTPFAHEFRYPMGLAIDANDNVFATDNQGVQNCFNEINHLVRGRRYGVPSRHEEKHEGKAYQPAIQVPHPLTRSVNGLFMLDKRFPDSSLVGHGVGCEYNGRFLIRFSYHDVGGALQGATYYLTKPSFKDTNANFLGPLCGAVAPNGDVYIGSIHDSGWLGGQNTGSIVRLRRNGDLPNGIREIRAVAGGFDIEFFKPVQANTASAATTYSISGYTRVFQGSYTSPDSGRHRVEVLSAKLSSDSRTVRLNVKELREGYVYEISVKSNTGLWPETGHYTMLTVPK
ncbi:MAG: hypothetical protein CMJ78_23165 [Planctomycetaceae bacterium]|nr:hypothetical protein [Planctomycetaceae bacterium]